MCRDSKSSRDNSNGRSELRSLTHRLSACQSGQTIRSRLRGVAGSGDQAGESVPGDILARVILHARDISARQLSLQFRRLRALHSNHACAQCQILKTVADKTRLLLQPVDDLFAIGAFTTRKPAVRKSV